ncbi:organic cation transporter protein-like, partial [Saccoglossus kowalevskii]
MYFDDILVILGEFGRYQKIQFVLVCLVAIPSSYFLQANTFMSASSDHYCKVYDNQKFHDTSPLKNCTIPYDAEDEAWDSCSRYDVNVSMGISPELCSQNSGTLECDNGWVYDTSVYENTVVHEFDLVCEKDWMKQLSKSIVPLGNLVGGIVIGQLSDIFGRKPMFIFTLMTSIVVGVIAAFSPSYPFFIICQFLLGVVSIAVFLVAFVIVVELVGTSYRTDCSICTMLFAASGLIVLGVCAALTDGNWRQIQLIGGLLSVFFIPYIWLVPESVRWLIQKEKYDKAERILNKAAKTNKVSLPEDMFKEEREMAAKAKEGNADKVLKKDTMLDLFKTPNLRNRTINICFNWFANSFVYYGIALNTDQLGTNPYITYLVYSAVEFPSYLLCWYLLDKVGRRWLLCSYMVFGGIALIISVPPDNVNIATTFAMIGKFFIAGSFAIVYVFSAELYPTTVRNAGMGLASTWARVGSMVSPYVMLLIDVWYPMPYLMMGITSIMAGLLALLLPETLKKNLPETLEEGELFGTKYYQKEEKENLSKQTVEMEIQCDLDQTEDNADHTPVDNDGFVNKAFR